jgi:hypothetical protein
MNTRLKLADVLVVLLWTTLRLRPSLAARVLDQSYPPMVLPPFDIAAVCASYGPVFPIPDGFM